MKKKCFSCGCRVKSNYLFENKRKKIVYACEFCADCLSLKSLNPKDQTIRKDLKQTEENLISAQSQTLSKR